MDGFGCDEVLCFEVLVWSFCALLELGSWKGRAYCSAFLGLRFWSLGVWDLLDQVSM